MEHELLHNNLHFVIEGRSKRALHGMGPCAATVAAPPPPSHRYTFDLIRKKLTKLKTVTTIDIEVMIARLSFVAERIKN
jgi:hypothetical protein